MRKPLVLEIFGVYHQKEVLEYYTSRIQSPICKNNECHEVEIDFYWDILGNFTKFERLPNKPLTKLDHEPFTENDYQQLLDILKDSSPPFTHLKKSQLINDDASKVSNIDGISGATVTSIKDYMIGGAVYTCYTLWHIANGDIEFQLAEYTKQNLNEAFIHQLLQSQKTAIKYFLIENLTPKYFELFFDRLTIFLEKADPYLISQFIQKIPLSLLPTAKAQNYITNHLNQLDLRAETNLFKKLQTHQIPLTPSTTQVLIDRINSFDFSRNEQIILLIANPLNNKNIAIVERLLKKLITQKIRVSSLSFNQLSTWTKTYPRCKKMLRKLKVSA